MNGDDVLDFKPAIAQLPIKVIHINIRFPRLFFEMLFLTTNYYATCITELHSEILASE